ncbi:hypothetical protein WN67_32475, partial [Mycolicibacterium obuense]
MTWAAVSLALAVLVLPQPSAARRLGARRVQAPGRGAPPSDAPLAVAATLDAFAACLRAGMAVSTAAAAV